jgi:hypothetical protein
MTITQQLKNAAINGSINLEKALKIAQAYDEQCTTTTALLKECERNVGMYLGEKINEHIAEMDGAKFNAVDYHYERPVGEQ